ncbi:restriction endonuclease [Xanthomonas campestris pv. campestris]|uniref:restriction endonuclease n=1 Tax=Xanthomonas campestris TaxID=339 RepID=UPI002AD292D7|nr:restriction endonuclease [Xanthomonas campestris]MEA0735750.1 restriction endonuclease [Xanthomonas campestris pv. campestris]
MSVSAFFAIRNGVPSLLSRQSGPVLQGFNHGISATLTPLEWMVLTMCRLAALASFTGIHRRRKLLDASTTLESLAANGWRQLELLVGEVFRRQGYAVEITGLCGADVCIDLILLKDVRRVLVQRKKWKRQQVGVSVVREMFGWLMRHNAAAVKIVCFGPYAKVAEQAYYNIGWRAVNGDDL